MPNLDGAGPRWGGGPQAGYQAGPCFKGKSPRKGPGPRPGMGRRTFSPYKNPCYNKADDK